MKLQSLIHILIGIVCIGLLPNARAVVPAPDGGYPGLTTAEGQNALKNLTTGSGNTAVGWYSLFSDATGSFNTGVGAGALALNTAENNTATGAAALLLNTTGTNNTANGSQALVNNTTGSGNTANGTNALLSNTTGSTNTAVHWLWRRFFLTRETGIRLRAERRCCSTRRAPKTRPPVWAPLAATRPVMTILPSVTSPEATSRRAVDNICIGHHGVSAESNTIRIGITGTHTSTYIGGIAGQTVGAGGSTCYVDNDGKLGVFPSARRFKTDIADMDNASEALMALRPVTFHYKPELDKTGIPQFGLIAEEVAKVNPDLVTHDANGELSTVRYEAVNAMLLNEFLKAHKVIEEQQTTIAQLKKEMQTVVARLNAHDSRIQSVSDQLQSNSPEEALAASNR